MVTDTMRKFESVQEYFDELEYFRAEALKLRKIVTAVGFDEVLKWSMPVYVYGGKNVVGIYASKKYVGLWFYQGVLLTDPDQVLVNAQAGKTKAMRHWRFDDLKKIKTTKIKKYCLEAMSLAEQGKEIKPNRNKPVNVPVELEKALAVNEKAALSFNAMSKSYRREYADYISDAKRADTKQRRIEKIIPMILDSVGLNDKYR